MPQTIQGGHGPAPPVHRTGSISFMSPSAGVSQNGGMGSDSPLVLDLISPKSGIPSQKMQRLTAMEPDPTAAPLLQLYCTVLVGGGSNPSARSSEPHSRPAHCKMPLLMLLTHKSQRNKSNGQIETVSHQPNRPRHVPFGPITPKRHKDAATLLHGASKATPSSKRAS